MAYTKVSDAGYPMEVPYNTDGDTVTIDQGMIDSILFSEFSVRLYPDEMHLHINGEHKWQSRIDDLVGVKVGAEVISQSDVETIKNSINVVKSMVGTEYNLFGFDVEPNFDFSINWYSIDYSLFDLKGWMFGSINHYTGRAPFKNVTYTVGSSYEFPEIDNIDLQKGLKVAAITVSILLLLVLLIYGAATVGVALGTIIGGLGGIITQFA